MRKVIFLCVIATALALGSIGVFNIARPTQPRATSLPSAMTAPTTMSTVDQEPEQFRWRGKPIHPGVIYELTTDLSNSDSLVAAVNVEGACDSQRFNDASQLRPGFVSYRDRVEFGTGYFEYKYLGRSSDGKHVLLTCYCGGGSGIFEDILIVKFSHDQLNKDGVLHDRTRMTLVGDFILGDRDDGKIEMHGDTLFIGRSRYRKDDQIVSLSTEVPG